MPDTFPLAPARRNYDWDKAIAFALSPAAAVTAGIFVFEGDATLALIVGTAGFLATLACALLLARPDHGHVRLDDTTLHISSGRLQTRLALADLDLAAALTPARPGANTITLITDPAKTVTIPGRQTGSVSVSPLDPAALLSALRAAARD